VPAPRRIRETAQFGPTVDAAAERLNISPTAVEKDYWVSEVLRVLVEHHAADFVFKGGTSLSKACGIVQRFSEDIDILVLAAQRGRGATDKLMKSMAEAAAAGVDGIAAAVGRAETGRHRAYEVSYPAMRPATEFFRTSVLLEMGVRGGDHPSEPASIGCLLGDALADAGEDLDAYADLKPFELVVLHPGRTLLEKLVLVHGEAQRLSADPKLMPDRRIGRHFYDIHELLGNHSVRALISDRPEVDRILDDVAKVTQKYFGASGAEFEIRPSTGFAASPAFQSSSDVSQRFQAAYDSTMPELYFGSEPLASWPEILRSVASAADVL
jgi:hypothetical protein